MKGRGHPKPIKVRKSWPTGFNPKTKVKDSDKFYERQKDWLRKAADDQQ